jgi:hypothetical protein
MERQGVDIDDILFFPCAHDKERSISYRQKRNPLKKELAKHNSQQEMGLPPKQHQQMQVFL